MMGVPLQKNDWIVAPFQIPSNGASLRFGKVIDMYQGKALVNWTHSAVSYDLPTKPTKIDISRGRFLILDGMRDVAISEIPTHLIRGTGGTETIRNGIEANGGNI